MDCPAQPDLRVRGGATAAEEAKTPDTQKQQTSRLRGGVVVWELKVGLVGQVPQPAIILVSQRMPQLAAAEVGEGVIQVRKLAVHQRFGEIKVEAAIGLLEDDDVAIAGFQQS